MEERRIWERLWEDSEGAYGALMRRRALCEEPEMEQVKQLMRLVRNVYAPGMRVLDVGCGAGHFYPSLKKIDPDISYTGVDVSEHYVGLGQKLFAGEKSARISRGDVFDLKFEDGAFDIVLCYMVLPFIPDWKKAVDELMRVSRKHIFMRLLLSDYTYIIRIYKNGGGQRRSV